MKLMIASDIHGSARWCRKLMEAFEREDPSRLVLLGDVLYHGPRNDLPDEYSPKEVIGMLNKIADKILCVRGNCDAEVDDMVLDFPVLPETLVVFDGDRNIYFCHGHKDFPKAPVPCTVVSGHTHIPVNYEKDGVVYINPGSISIPKENSGHGYIIYENGIFVQKNLN